MSKMKKWVLSCSCLIIAVCGIFAFSRFTLAAFTDRETAVNTVTTGKVTTEIEETLNGLEKSNICVKNTGDKAVPVYVRVMVTLPKIDNIEPTVAQPESLMWKFCEADGYWYYKGILGAGETTYNLYDWIKYENLPADVNLDLLQIIVYAESIQADNLALETANKNSAEAAIEAFALLKP